MHELLVSNPVTFINAITPFETHFILFCAVVLPWLTIAWILLYLLFRPIPNQCVFAPLENISRRLFNLAVVALATLAALASSVVAKNHFQIGRPELLNFGLHPLLLLSDYGFPSGHATVFAALAAALFFINRRAGTYAALLALIIGVARILAGVHTPLDILGGYLLGVVIASIISFIAEACIAPSRIRSKSQKDHAESRTHSP